MPRNRFTKQVRKLERKQFDQQERELGAIEKRLRRAAEPTDVSPFNQDKVRRSARLDKKRRHKAKRRSGVNGTSKK